MTQTLALRFGTNCFFLLDPLYLLVSQVPLFVLSSLLSSLWVSRTGSASDWCALQEVLYKCIDTIQYNTLHTYTHTNIHTYLHTYTHKYINIFVRTYNICTHTCKHTHMHRYIHIYIHICIGYSYLQYIADIGYRL